MSTYEIELVVDSLCAKVGPGADDDMKWWGIHPGDEQSVS